MRYFLMIMVAVLSLTIPAYALSQQDVPDYPEEIPPLPKPKGDALPWETFLQTKEKQKKVTFPDGSYSFEVTPDYSDALKELNGKNITLHGFMFPLEQSEKQSNFLMGPFPPSCPFHYHTSPKLVVEVLAKKPVDFSWDEVTLKGRLELDEKATNGVYYFLKEAEKVE